MLLPEYRGGLGNIMFELSGIYGIAKQTGHRFGLPGVPKMTYLTDRELTSPCLKPWETFIVDTIPTQRFEEYWSHPIDLDLVRSWADTETVVMNGWYQHVKYFHSYREEIVKLFDLPSINQYKYYDIDEAYFLHVRRGDYLNNVVHYLNFDYSYYPRALEIMKHKGVAYVCSDDPEYCEDWNLLQDVRHRIIRADELTTLSVMKQCGLGGICANSSFSWWGLYLDTSRSSLIMPCTWFAIANYFEHSSNRYRFPEATVISVW